MAGRPPLDRAAANSFDLPERFRRDLTWASGCAEIQRRSFQRRPCCRLGVRPSRETGSPIRLIAGPVERARSRVRSYGPSEGESDRRRQRHRSDRTADCVRRGRSVVAWQSPGTADRFCVAGEADPPKPIPLSHSHLTPPVGRSQYIQRTQPSNDSVHRVDGVDDLPHLPRVYAGSIPHN